MFEALQRYPQSLKNRVARSVREKAILRTKARLVENRVQFSELSDEELEIIIKDEEDRLIGEYKTKSIVALLALLGISLF